MRIESVIFIIFLFITFALGAQNLEEGRVGFYNFSGNANDLINNNNGTAFGASLSSDRFGNSNSAYNFDGINDFIELPHSDLLNFDSDQDFSISLWVFIPTLQTGSSNTNNEIIGKWNAVNSQGYPFAIRYLNENAPNGNEFKFAVLRYDSEACNNNPLQRSECAISVENWYHIVYIKSNDELFFYQNAELISVIEDNTSKSCSTQNNEPILIGKRQANQRHYKGKIDDLIFYNRALSDVEINILFSENSWVAPPPESSNTDILSYQISTQVSAPIINKNDHKIDVIVQCDTDLANITHSFELAKDATATVNGITQISGVTSNNFTSPLIFTVQAENNCNVQDWVVNVTQELLSDQQKLDIATIESFSFSQQTAPAIINPSSRSVDIEILCNADISALIATFSLSNGANAFINGNLQTSGMNSNDYSNQLIHTIISQDNCAQIDWVINVTQELLSDQQKLDIATIESFSFSQQTAPAIINPSSRSVDIEILCNADISALIANFSLSNGANSFINGNLQTSGMNTNDYSNQLIHTVISQDNCAQIDWVINVTQANTIELDNVFIPNIITPNGDGKNDTWKFNGFDSENYDIKVMIFNRWGRLVLKTNDYDMKWSALELSNGVYYYNINISECDQNIKGWVHVLNKP